MGSRATETVDIEAVVIGFQDSRCEKPTPIGFVFSSGNEDLRVYALANIEQIPLPPLFSATVKTLPRVIHKAAVAKAPVAGVYKFLVENCFDGLGSLRCWQPLTQKMVPADVEAYIDGLKSWVSAGFQSQVEVVVCHEQSCAPGHWQRLPEYKVKIEPESPTCVAA